MTHALLDELRARGLLHDHTDLDALGARLDAGPTGVYVGFDPTADSLHVGHLVGQLSLRRFQLAGHRPFPLAGGATGMVGDPSGRSEERNLLDEDALRANVAAISRQLERLLDFEPGPHQATLVNNADWFAPVRVLDFLRDVGKHVTVNQMLAKESIKGRIESEHGISYTEFSYMLLQADDFRHLYEHHGVEVQGGGSDQWGNITAGIDLIRRRLRGSAHGLTWPLLTRADGQKMGKTADGAVWLDPARTSPYRFSQYWVQTDDADVAGRLLALSLRPLEEVRDLVTAHAEAPERRSAQWALADELTALVHGEAAAAAARGAAAVLFGGHPEAASAAALEAVAGEVVTVPLPSGEGDGLVALLKESRLVGSTSEGRRALQQGGVYLNGERVSEDRPVSTADLLHGRYALLRRGKKSYAMVVGQG